MVPESTHVLARATPPGSSPRNPDRDPNRRRAGAVTMVLTAGAVLVAGAVVLPTLFQRYLGPADPRLTVVVVLAIGAAALRRLDATDQFVAWDPAATRRGIPIAAGAALAFAGLAITIDLVVGYPADLNVAIPAALLFYPGIALVAETLFHLVPLALLVVLAGRGGRQVSDADVVRAIAVAALVEPAFQLALTPDPVSWLGLLTAANVGAFGVVQLVLFRRHDFVTMLVMRLAYYAVWHLAWGTARLEVLFR